MKTFFILLFFLLLTVFVGGNSHETYAAGDTLKLDLRAFGTYTAEISAPAGEYIQKSTDPFFFFELGEEGNYTFVITSSLKKQVFSFVVGEELLEEEPLEEKDLELVYYDIEGLNYTKGETPLAPEERDRIDVKNERIKVGEEVRWVRKKYVTQRKDLVLKVPKASRELVVTGEGEIDYEVRTSLKDSALSIIGFASEKDVELTDVQGAIELTYTTPAPKKKREKDF